MNSTKIPTYRAAEQRSPASGFRLFTDIPIFTDKLSSWHTTKVSIWMLKKKLIKKIIKIFEYMLNVVVFQFQLKKKHDSLKTYNQEMPTLLENDALSGE